MGNTIPRIWATLDPFLETGAVWGRKVANEQFLRALLGQDPFDAYHFFLSTPKQARDVRDTFSKNWPELTAAKRLRFFLRQNLPSALQTGKYHCFHLSDCITHPPALARLRNAYSPEIFPVTSLTHSLSYPDYPARFLDHLRPDCSSRDCIVATSQAGKNAVQSAFDMLRQRLDLKPDVFLQPDIQVIPLGMDDPFAHASRDALRAKGRAHIQAAPEQCVLLVLGRVSPHSKMDLLPLLRAWQRAFPRNAPPALLVVAGWIDQGDDFPGTFSNLARNVGLPCRLVPRPGEKLKHELYAAADIFLSLSDNPQETFGLTLLEAALAQLPVIASDYSGYRDLVEHDRTGLLIPTQGPRDSKHVDVLAGLIPDYEIQFFLAQQTIVHVPSLADALRTLCQRNDLRAELGQNARQRALKRFSWPKIIHDHIALWDMLWTRDTPQSLLSEPRPLELSYSRMFSAFPGSTLHQDRLLVITRAGGKILRGEDFPVIYAGLEHLVSMAVLRPLLFFARKPLSVKHLEHRMKALDPCPAPWQITFSIHWAVKHDLLETLAD